MALLMFSGKECVHCKEMDPHVKKLEQEEKVKIKKLDVWHDSEAAKLMEKYDCDKNGETVCGGIPFFVNEETGAKICGNTSYEKLKTWAGK